MTVRKYAIRILVLALPLCAGVSASAAISDSLLDDQADGAKTNGSVPSNWSEPATTVVEVTIPPSKPGAPAERVLSANPLWAMPIKQFSVTRDRPIFLPSRRPPAPPVFSGDGGEGDRAAQAEGARAAAAFPGRHHLGRRRQVWHLYRSIDQGRASAAGRRGISGLEASIGSGQGSRVSKKSAELRCGIAAAGPFTTFRRRS